VCADGDTDAKHTALNQLFSNGLLAHATLHGSRRCDARCVAETCEKLRANDSGGGLLLLLGGKCAGPRLSSSLRIRM
jgi:hypothetical protein